MSASPTPPSSTSDPTRDCEAPIGLHRMEPLIRGTLVALYLALVLPLPLLAPPGLKLPLALALPLGGLLVLAITSEQVCWDSRTLRVGLAPWCRWLPGRRGWQLDWETVTAIVAVGTSQGGRVYYLRCRHGEAWLLPQRITDLEGFLAQLTRATGLETGQISRLTPPWTYRLLAGLCALMLAGEAIALGLNLIG